MSILINSFDSIPEQVIVKWQEITDMLAEMLNIPAALIKKTENKYLEVFISIHSEKNPYHPGDKKKWYGLYCDTVIKSQDKLLVTNALKDENRDKNPDIELGIISYLEFPMNFPDNKPFVTIRVLDLKENQYSEKTKKRILQFKDVIESDLVIIQSFDVKTTKLSDTVKKQCKELHEKNRELLIAEESDRLKTKSSRDISRETRTPMNAILGFSKLMHKKNLSKEKRNHSVNLVKQSGNNILNIIDDILEVSRLETMQVKIKEEEFCLNDLCLQLFIIFNKSAKSNKTPLYLKKGLFDDESAIISDEGKLNKILSNLIDNAIKYTNEGYIEFGYTIEENAYIQFYVKDTGIGISRKKQLSVFKLFSKEEDTSKNIGGLGLGLSIAKENALLLGGDIKLISEKGKGSTFIVTLPYKPANPSKISREKISQQTVVLVAEDEEVNSLYIEALLEDDFNLNCRIIQAKNEKKVVET